MTTRFAIKPDWILPRMVPTPIASAGYVVSAARATSCEIPRSMILLRFFLKSAFFFNVPEVKLKRIPASKTFLILSGAISQCFNCSLENCSAR